MSALPPKADIAERDRHARLSGGGVVAAMNSTDAPHRHRRSRKEAACEGNGAALYDDAPDAAE
jgi:hypothetical protein